MAKILMCMPPLTGHTNPARAVAHELRQRGHVVGWAIVSEKTASAEIASEQVAGKKNVCEAESDPVFKLPIDFSADLGTASGAVRGLESVRFFYEEFCVPLAQATLPQLDAIVARFQPDLLFVDHQMLSGALIARRHRLPWLTSVTTSASIVKMSPALDQWIEEQLLQLQTQNGVRHPVARPDISPHGAVVFSSEVLIGSDRERLDGQFHFVGPAYARREFCDFPWSDLIPGKRKILISLGTISRDHGQRFFDVMMAALADLDVQVIMVAPPELAVVAPPNFIVRERVPQIELLGHVDAVICHAGHNTVCETLAHGLPLIVAPIRDDQPVIARQVVNAGAALSMRFGKVSPALARQKIEQLLTDPTLVENAKRLQQSLRQLGGAAHVADIAEALLIPAAARCVEA